MSSRSGIGSELQRPDFQQRHFLAIHDERLLPHGEFVAPRSSATHSVPRPSQSEVSSDFQEKG